MQGDNANTPWEDSLDVASDSVDPDQMQPPQPTAKPHELDLGMQYGAVVLPSTESDPMEQLIKKERDPLDSFEEQSTLGEPVLLPDVWAEFPRLFSEYGRFVDIVA